MANEVPPSPSKCVYFILVYLNFGTIQAAAQKLICCIDFAYDPRFWKKVTR